MSTTVESLREAMRARRVADLRYKEVIREAKAEGWSNTKIARAVGVTEAAIRMYYRRHDLGNLFTSEDLAS